MDPLLIFMVLAVGAMFLLTSRSRKQQRQAGEFRHKLEVGDEVMTGSGMFGTIIDIDGDVITLESPSGGQTDWLRAAISKKATPPWGAEDEDEEPAGEDEELVDDESGDDEIFLEDDDEAELDVTPDTWGDDEPDRDRRRAGADGAPAVPLTKGTPQDSDPEPPPQEPPTRP